MSAQIISVLSCVFFLFCMSRVQMAAATSEIGFMNNNKKQAHFAATTAIGFLNNNKKQTEFEAATAIGFLNNNKKQTHFAATTVIGFLNSQQDHKKQTDFEPKPRIRLERDVADYENRNEQPLQCQYSGRQAECNGDQRGGRRFTYIPPLPKYITSLSFQFNHLDAVRDKAFFANVTQLTELDLSNNDIAWVGPGVFGLMPELSVLHINSNPPLQNMSSLRSILATPSLSYVGADYCGFPSFKGRILADDDISRVKELEFKDNSMGGTFDFSPLCPLKQLVKLNLFSNKITAIDTKCVLSALTDLNLDFNNLVRFIPTCDLRGNSFFPKLEVLEMSRNKIPSIIMDICLPNLQRLILHKNDLGFDYFYDAFDDLHFPALQELNLELNNLLSRNGLRQQLFYNSPVRKLYLTGNEMDFGSKVDIDTFSSCTNISELWLDNNVFSSVSDERFQAMFGHLPLVRLSLRRTEFTAVSPKTFWGLTQLEELELCCNKIVYIPDGTFDHLVNLRYLDLSQNQIKTIGPRTFSDRLRENLLGLCAHSNPFVCSCDLVWFQSWLHSNSELFVSSSGSFFFRCNQKYVCSDKNNTVSDFVIPEQACLMSQEVGGYIITFCTTVTVTLTTLLLLFTYRWHLRLLVYEAFRGRDDGARQRRLLQNNFDYDVFVSYDSEDSNWVKQRLLPELEGHLGLKLCIHERDFTLGRNIVDNIGECVESSKKVLMVFSNNFVLSQWCQFELTYCLRHVMDYDDALLIVCVDDVTNREMTTAMMAVLKTTTYIQWAGYDDAIRAFWGRLRIALREITDLEHRV